MTILCTSSRSTLALAVLLGLALEATRVTCFTPPLWSTTKTKPFVTAATTTETTASPTLANNNDNNNNNNNNIPKAAASPDEIRSIQAKVEAQLKSRHNTRVWNALFVSCPEQSTPLPVTAQEGSIPTDFPPGCLLRLGPNGAAASEGFFDGDGMIQCITFPPQSQSSHDIHTDKKEEMPIRIPMHSAPYLETRGRTLERATNQKFKGTLGGLPYAYPMIQSLVQNAIAFQTLQAQKDTCNTALACHGGRIMALMEQCPPTELQVFRDGRIVTVEACATLNGAIDTNVPISGGTLSAHGRTCPTTGERIHVSYRSDEKPYLRLDVFAPNEWQLLPHKSRRGIDIPTPIFLHDSCLTPNYVVVLDFPLTLRTSRVLQNRFPVEYEPNHPARIGLVPRNNNNADIRWFHCQPGVVLHLCNAWESDSGNTVIIQGLRGEPTPQECYLSKVSPSYLYEYSIDLSTGVVTEQTLNPYEVLEFPVVNEQLYGQESSACYCLSMYSIGGPLHVYRQPQEGVVFDGIVKLATIDTDQYKKGSVIAKYELPQDWYPVSEPTIVPKTNGDGEYVLVIATYVPPGVTWEDVANDYDAALQSKVMILDGNDLEAGPVYSATLPQHVPYGLHSDFIDWKDMKE